MIRSPDGANTEIRTETGTPDLETGMGTDFEKKNSNLCGDTAISLHLHPT